MANQYLGLSLFVMLLSFFIILVALSNFEEAKSRPVLSSLTIAFSSKDNVEDLSPNIETDPMQSFRKGDSLDKLQDLFKAQVPGVEVQKNRLGTMMHLRMEVDAFEKQLLRPVRESENVANFESPFAGTLIAILSSKDSVPYRMDMLLNLENEPSDMVQSDPEGLRYARNKVSIYAQTLESAGMPVQLMTSGFHEGDDDYIDLYFRRYIPFNPVGE